LTRPSTSLSGPQLGGNKSILEGTVMKSEIDQLVTQAAHDFVRSIGVLNEDNYIREAIMKLAVEQVTWSMLETFHNKDALIEQLKFMIDVIKDDTGY
jgi:hypothetical protein